MIEREDIVSNFCSKKNELNGKQLKEQCMMSEGEKREMDKLNVKTSLISRFRKIEETCLEEIYSNIVNGKYSKQIEIIRRFIILP